MALDAGDAQCKSGLAAEIYTRLTGDPRAGFSAPMSADQRASVQAICFSIAAAVVAHLTANAEVRVPVTIGGVQQYVEPTKLQTVDTLKPREGVFLDGTIL